MSYNRFEVKAASLLVGCVLIALGILAAFGGERDPLHVVLTARGTADSMAVVMVCLGFMTVYGSIRPKRACRQIGLAFGSLVMLQLFGSMMLSNWLTLTSLLLVMFAVASIGIFIADVRGRVNAS